MISHTKVIFSGSYSIHLNMPTHSDTMPPHSEECLLILIKCLLILIYLALWPNRSFSFGMCVYAQTFLTLAETSTLIH